MVRRNSSKNNKSVNRGVLLPLLVAVYEGGVVSQIGGVMKANNYNSGIVVAGGGRSRNN